MREVVLDSETTGLFADKDRLIEIGAIELENYVPTGRVYHQYINPLREVSLGAFKVHGISNDFLKDKPYFQEIVDDFLTFIGDAPLIAHNATFDMRFFNEELRRIGIKPLENEVIDTLEMARKIKPGGYHSLDAMCRFYNIDTSKRKKHGALLDSELLAEVYLNMRGGRQFGMELIGGARRERQIKHIEQIVRPHVSIITYDEMMDHAAFVADLPNAIWDAYLDDEAVAAA